MTHLFRKTWCSATCFVADSESKVRRRVIVKLMRATTAEVAFIRQASAFGNLDHREHFLE